MSKKKAVLVIVSAVCPECGEKYETTPEGMFHDGTPVCPDCDVDCEYGGVEVR